MPNEQTRPSFAVGLIERYDHALLIALPAPSDDDKRLWVFPRGRIEPGESPEVAMRRIAQDHLEIEVEVVVGQPPIIETIDGEEVELRYMFCGILTGDPFAGPYKEIRWAPKQQLREYDFDSASIPVVEWILET
jgi:8-oxo-dGTP diphosphatase